MAKVRVLYWKEIPAQVQAEDESVKVSRQLDERFQAGVDSISMLDGSASTDDYMDAWMWGEYTEIDGSAEQAADQMVEHFNRGFPEDLIQRITKLHRSGERETHDPGLSTTGLRSANA